MNDVKLSISWNLAAIWAKTKLSAATICSVDEIKSESLAELRGTNWEI